MGGHTTAAAKKPASATTTSSAQSSPRTPAFTPAFTPATPAYLGSYDEDLGVCTMEPTASTLESRVEIPPQLRLDPPPKQSQSALDLRPAAKVPDDQGKKAAPDAQSPDPAAADAADNVAMTTGSKPADSSAPAASPGNAGGGSGQSAGAPKGASQAGDEERSERRPSARALPRAGTPETGPVALRWGPVQLPVSAPAYLASPSLGIEPAKPPATTGDKQKQPVPQLPDYRGAYARAIDGGARFHALVLGAARKLASQARDQNEEYRRRQESMLAVTLRSFDDGLNFNRTSLRTGRDVLLSKVQSQAWSLRSRVATAASAAHAKLTGKVAGYRTQIDGLQTSGDAVAKRAFGGITDVDTSGKAATAALARMKTAIPGRFEITDGFPKWAVRNEAIQTFLPLRVDKLSKNIEDTRKNVTASLSKSFACLKCNVDSSRQAFEYSTMIVEKPAHEAVDAAAAGGYKSIDAAADQLTLAIHESFARSDAGLVEQHRAMRAGAIGNAQEVARQERAGLADAAMRQVAALSAVAGAQAAAGAKVRDTLARDKTLAEPAFASSVTQAATRFAQNIGNVGKVHPRTTADAAEKLQAGRMQRAAAYERGQAASMLATDRSFEKIVTDSLTALGQHIGETLDSLQSVPGDVRKSSDSSLQPLDDAFFNGLADYRDSIARLAASVEAVLSLQAPEEVVPSEKREQPKGKDGKDGKGDKAGDKPGGKDQQASNVPPPPAPPASCAGCPPPEQKEKAAKKQDGNDPNLSNKDQSGGQSSTDAGDNNTSAGSDKFKNAVCQVQAPNPASPDEFIKSNRKIALNPWGVAPFAAFVENCYDKVSNQVNTRADTIHAKMSWSSTNRKAITEQLKGMTKLQGVAVEDYYNFVYDPDLREALNSQLRSKWSTRKTNNNNVAEAIQALDGDASGSAFSGLTAAFNWSNEFDRAKQILLDMTPAQLAQMRKDHGDELESFANELYGEQKEIFKALVAGHPEEARAIELRRDLDKNDYIEAQKRADANDKLVEDALNEGYGQAAYMDEKATTADAFGLGRDAKEAYSYDLEDHKSAEAQRQAHIEKMETAFGFLPGVIDMGGGTQSDMAGSALYYYATRTPDWNLDYYRRYPPPPGTPAYERMKYLEANPSPYRGPDMAPTNKLVIEMMLRHGPNSEEAKGARLLKERRRTGGDPKPEDLDKALHVGTGDAREGGGYSEEERKRREKGKEEAEKTRDRIFLLSEQFRYQLEGGNPPPKDAKDARATVQAEIERAYPRDEKARAVALGILKSDEGNFEAVVEYAASKEKTELLTTYLGRRDRAEIKEFTKKYNDTHDVPLEKRLGLFEHHWSMGNMNGAVFSGDKANKLEIAWMGVPQNTKERSEVALRVMDQAIDQAGGLGSLLASGEYEALKANARRLRAAMGVTPDMVDSRGEIRSTDPLTGLPVEYGHFDKNGELRQEYRGDKNALSVAMGMAQMYADNYAEATDRIASFVTMALVIAAAVITTALTGGAAASIWLPMLVTAGAGLVGIGLTAAIKGGRYGRDDLVRDLAMTVVQTLTAGIGAAGSVAARGGMPALRAVASRGVSQGFRISEKALEKFVISKGGTLAASASFGAELGIAAGSGALSGGVVAALDPANKDSGEYGWRILGGMFRGAAGGMVGAGMARGVATGLGAVGNRIAGAAASRSANSALASGLSREQALEQALLAARRAQWVSAGVTRAISSGASGSTSRMTELALEGKASFDEILAEGRSAFIQNMLQGAIEHAADPGTRNPFGKGAKLSESELRTMPSWQREEQGHMRAMAEKAVGKAYDAPEGASGQPPAGRRGAADPPEPANDNERRVASAAAGEPEGRVIAPARLGEEGVGPFPTGRTPVTEEPGSLGPHARPSGADDEPVAILRSAAGSRDEEQPARLRSSSGWDDEKTNPAIPIKHPEFPNGVDLRPGMLEKMPLVLPETPVNPANPKDGVQARQNYDLLRNHPPQREVLLAYNPNSGDYMVLQGMPHSVKPPPEGWITLRHSHGKVEGGDKFVHFTSVLPSGIGGDFSVLRTEVDRMPGAHLGAEVRRSSVIDIEVNGKHVQTTFEITRKGDNYSLTVTIDPPMHGVSSLGPFTGDRHEAVRQYAYKARDLTSGGSDFGLGHNKPPSENLMNPGSPAPPRVVRNATLSEAERHDALFVAGRMAQSEAFDRQAQAGLKGEFDPVIARAATSGDAQDRVRAMGLVGKPDSLERLTRLLNSSDPAFTPEMRSAVARATLEATRADLIRSGNLAPGDELLMLFRGVTGPRTDDYEKGGMDLSKLGPGRDEDAGRGLYGSQDFESARNYAGSDGQGVVLPLIVRRSELGNVIDVRQGTPLGDRWLAYVRATARGGVVKESHPHLGRVLYPFSDSPIGVYRDGRGDRFEAFLRTLADDPTLPPAIREAARDPHITLMDLGGVASWGNDRHMLTDQFAMHHQRVLDLFNEAHGFPRPGPDEGTPMLRSAAGGPKGEGDGGGPPAPQPLLPAPDTLPHFDRALELALRPSLRELEGLVKRSWQDQPLIPAQSLTDYVREPNPATRAQMRADIADQLAKTSPKLSGKDLLAVRRSLVTLEEDLHGYLNTPIRQSAARLPELGTSVVASYILDPTPAGRAAARQAIFDHLAAQNMEPKRIQGILRELVSLEDQVGGKTRMIAGHLRDAQLAASTDAAIPANMRRAVDHSPPLALLAARDPALFGEIAAKYFKKVNLAEAGGDAEQFFIEAIRAKARLKSAKNASVAANATALLAQMEPLRAGIGDFRGGLAAAIRDVRGPEDLSHSRGANRQDQNFDGRIPLLAEDGVVPGMRVDHYLYGRATVMAVDGDTVMLLYESAGAQRTAQVRLSDLDTFPALNTTGEQVPAVVPLRTAAEQKKAQEQIDDLRTSESLPKYGHETEAGTISIARASGEEGIGSNSTLAARTVNLSHEERAELLGLFKALGLDHQDTTRDPRFVHHGELASLVELRGQLRRAGKPMPEVVELFVDRATCDSCSKNLSVVAAYLGIPELRVYTRGQAAGTPPLIIRAR